MKVVPPDPKLYERLRRDLDAGGLPVAVAVPEGLYTYTYNVDPGAVVTDPDIDAVTREFAICTVILITADRARASR